MQWQPVTNDNDILRDGDMFRLQFLNGGWSNWAPIETSAGMTRRNFVRLHAPLRSSLSGIDPAAMVEVRRPVTEEGVQ